MATQLGRPMSFVDFIGESKGSDPDTIHELIEEVEGVMKSYRELLAQEPRIRRPLEEALKGARVRMREAEK